MHPNPTFRTTTRQDNVAFARERGFGLLAMSNSKMPLMSHVPFLLSEDGTQAELHLVRSNPMARAISGVVQAKIAVSGPDAYISPDWYDLPDQVPTWNYVAVHLSGTLEPLPQDVLPALLDRLSAHFEAQLLPKAPWTRDKMTAEVFDRMTRMIQPFRLSVTDIDGTWKLNQNKQAEARLAAAQEVYGQALGQDTRALAALMQSSFADSDQG
ncbi:FMN-binding negative transcriptional regulator [Shimia abyssi]|nr:FMN-binding negative transcriptional regulator [Shimia abyssi]